MAGATAALLVGAVLLIGHRDARAAFGQNQSGALVYTLDGPLKQNWCGGDTDHDCLNNNKEDELAWIVSPHYLRDGNEGCDSGQHFEPKDFIQVRPISGTGATQYIGNWVPNDGNRKWVTITYHILFPHDCTDWGFQGHIGDGEKAQFVLSSDDLVSWRLEYVRMYHHGSFHDFYSNYVATIASLTGTVYAILAYDEDGHGSWPGVHPTSSDCAGSQDDGVCFGGCQCFTGSLQNAFNTYAWRYLGTSRNLGGPWPEMFKPNIVNRSGSDVYSEFDVGHGLQREYWTSKAGFGAFCGWECSNTSRNSGGHCIGVIHNNDGCSTPLYQLLDTSNFYVGPPGYSCSDAWSYSCGGYATYCNCAYNCTGSSCCWDQCLSCGGGCEWL